MSRLIVCVGPDRFNMEPARLNDTERPHEIDTEHFCGRVLVRVLDAPGARPGEPGREYFVGRSRKFCIQIEGRFKHVWNGDEVLFGSDFDKYVPFPRTPFNAGMRVAQMIDPCTFYEEHPPSGRPYIMSPYTACMNTFCAWPAPSRMHDAVVVHRHTTGDAHDHHSGDMVPVEHLQQTPEEPKKHGILHAVTHFGSSSNEDRVTPDYWRFVGFRDNPKVQAFVQDNLALQAPAQGDRRLSQGIDTDIFSMLGTNQKNGIRVPAIDRPDTPRMQDDAPPRVTTPGLGRILSFRRKQSGTPQSPRIASPVPQRPTPMPAPVPLSPVQNEPEIALADQVSPTQTRTPPAVGTGGLAWKSQLDDKLGPWRFADPGSDMLEDNAFIFTNESVSVPQRRRYFADMQNRIDFKYDTDVVYGASFFSNLMDFNTFDLSIGPVRINVNPFFREMPIRYTLRSKDENIVFCTISFQLAD